MKKIYYTLFIYALCFTSCNSLLDELPDNQVRIDTPEKVKRVVTNAYPTASTALISELSSDNIDDIGTVVTNFTFLANESAYWNVIQEYGDYDGLREIWTSHYKAINQANTALEAIQNLGDTEEMRPSKGEALVARAYAHFNLVNLFSKPYNPTTSSSDLGIPYMLHPETELDGRYSRGTVAQVYQQIDADLQQGLPLIRDSHYEMPKYHFNRRAAYAFAARFYLYYQQWQKALDAANVVLTTNDATTRNLLRNWREFRDATKTGGSDIEKFAIHYTRDDVDANLLLIPVYSLISTNYFTVTYAHRFIHNHRLVRNETLATQNLWDPSGRSGRSPYGYEFYWFSPFEVSDNRRDAVIFGKFPTFKEGSNTTRTIMVPFTTDETLLVRAEAKIHLTQYASALTDLNMFTSNFIQVKEINGYTSSNTVTQQQAVDFYNAMAYSQSTNSGATQKKKLNPSFTITADGVQEPLLHYVLQCRRVLTLGEGLRWQDVRRYNIEVARYQNDNINRNQSRVEAILPPDDLKRTIQLPDAVIGKQMTPNPR
ncbi:hypothetical protein RCZ04_13350 [Capnocytophaga sp. HP1101]